MFKVGDYAVITGSKYFPEYINTICQIIEPYEFRKMIKPDGSEFLAGRYIVRLGDGREGGMSFRHLRHINPPDERASWNGCAWTPASQPQEQV